MLILEQGQGWVTQLEAPASGDLIGIQVMRASPWLPSCGLYRVALRFPLAPWNNPYPSRIASAHRHHGHDEPQVWLLEGAPVVEEGPFALGSLSMTLARLIAPPGALERRERNERGDVALLLRQRGRLGARPDLSLRGEWPLGPEGAHRGGA